jgi:hypothetical protein
MMRTATAFVLAALLLSLSGCASQRVGYASWQHFGFSMKANWQEFVGWSPVASPEDAARADREGGWWGDEVPLWPAR